MHRDNKERNRAVKEMANRQTSYQSIQIRMH
nr:MAG TPA: hypothetical protein [Caudoviricetes sp.]